MVNCVSTESVNHWCERLVGCEEDKKKQQELGKVAVHIQLACKFESIRLKAFIQEHEFWKRYSCADESSQQGFRASEANDMRQKTLKDVGAIVLRGAWLNMPRFSLC